MFQVGQKAAARQAAAFILVLTTMTACSNTASESALKETPSGGDQLTKTELAPESPTTLQWDKTKLRPAGYTWYVARRYIDREPATDKSSINNSVKYVPEVTLTQRGASARPLAYDIRQYSSVDSDGIPIGTPTEVHCAKAGCKFASSGTQSHAKVSLKRDTKVIVIDVEYQVPESQLAVGQKGIGIDQIAWAAHVIQ